MITQQWDLTTMQAVQAWGYLPDQYLTALTAGNGANRVKVAVIDTGVDCTHPDFMNAGGSSTDSANGGQLSWSLSQAIEPTTISPAACPWQDIYGHGTHVAGTVAAATNNGAGVASVGYPLQVVAYQVFKFAGNQIGASDSDVAAAIDDAVNSGVQVISMSLGGPGYSQTMQSAMDYAWEHNVLVVAASGNTGSNDLNYPGGGNHVLGVGATCPPEGPTSGSGYCPANSINAHASFSTYGTWVKIAAPGVGILSTLPSYSGVNYCCNYGYLDGTSMATPHVAAVAGLLYMLYPNLGVADIAQRLQQTAQTPNTGWDQFIGYGVANPAAALTGTLSGATQGSLVGQVIQSNGTPLNGAHVTAGSLSYTTALDSSGDTNGLFRLANLAPGTYAVQVTRSGFTTVNTQAVVVAGADTMMTITMGVSTGQISGTVTHGGVGLAGASVEAISGGLVQAIGITDGSGNYSVSVPAGTYTLTASAANYINATSGATPVGAGGTATVNLALTRYGTVTGTVKRPQRHHGSRGAYRHHRQQFHGRLRHRRHRSLFQFRPDRGDLHADGVGIRIQQCDDRRRDGEQ